ncbi:gliding motility-associated C-terminal domain-containing protein [Runella sp. MFBS21]|uniref:lectin-like domain-containing protein n=1 Tax=Runella sp. MFBS21 TaxID=3034018 RepID=UPI0023F96ACE|nr:gliding motility-associated C-terminal domain-containing protein [Runella sp. MFBS21]MDF7818286.1 gliding motility-associated C-terminal domain-containing protein [Runella sp. MFBS21]
MKNFIFFVFFSLYAVTAFTQTYYTYKDARPIDSECYRVTDARSNQFGVVWYEEKLNLHQSLNLEFIINFGSNDAGADGMAFIMQSRGKDVIGGSGMGLGFAGISPSLGVEFDTYNNGSGVGDLASDHMAILQNGSVNHLTPHNLQGPVSASATSPNIEDGKNHLVNIRWDSQTLTLEVYFDCQLRLRLNKDIVTDIFSGKPEVWWGISGSTGGAYNIQTVCLKKEAVLKNVFKDICPNQDVLLTGRPSSDGAYQWTPTTSLSAPSSRTPIARPTQTTTYTVSYRNDCGITVKDTIRVEVVPFPKVDFGSPKEICPKRTVEITPTFTPQDTAVRYRWSTGATIPKITVNQPGQYDLTLSKGNCNVKTSTEVIAGKPPSLAPNQQLCFTGLTLVLDAGTSEPNLRYLWNHSNETTPAISVSQPDKYEVLVSTEAGCEATRTIEVIASPTVKLGQDTTLCEGESLVVSPLITSPNPSAPYTYAWSSGAITPSITVSQTGTYTLHIIQNSCSASDSVQVTIEQCGVRVFAPDVFTPNSDGINDTFHLFITGGIPHKLTIYNRLGLPIYTEESPQPQWDGFFKNTLCPLDSYTYVFEYKNLKTNNIQRHYGSVMLQR